jgi:hypothetical protein
MDGDRASLFGEELPTQGEHAAESAGSAPPFEAGPAAAFGSGRPTPGEGVRRWS